MLGAMATLPISIRALVGHCKYTTAIVFRRILHVIFISERRAPIRLSTSTGPSRITCLDLCVVSSSPLESYLRHALTMNPGTRRWKITSLYFPSFASMRKL